MTADERGGRWLLAGLALQNLGRRRARTALLIAAVAISTAIVFTGTVMMRSIDSSMQVGFSRLGADLMLVPADTLVNITDALLAVEPTTSVLDAALLDRIPIAGIGLDAPQIVFRTSQSGFGGQGDSVDLIGFDPARDFTVLPWLTDRLAGPMRLDDVILGAARDPAVGAQIVLFGVPFRVYGKLARTGVGTHERGVFLSIAALRGLGPAIGARVGAIPPMLDPAKVSGFLIQLRPGATELQVRFALMSHLSGIKIVAGQSLLTGIRQGLIALLDGTLALMALTFLSTAVMVSVLFSAIITERRGELGVLKAIGARRGQILGAMLAEATFATGAGGAVGVTFGILLLRLFERSLVYYLTRIGIPFVWLDLPRTAAVGVACILGAVLVGAAGALVPAWRVSRVDAYDLIRGEG